MGEGGLGAARPLGEVGNGLRAHRRGAQRADPAVEERIGERPVETRRRNSITGADGGQHLPIAVMGGDEDHRPATRRHRFQHLPSHHLEAGAGGGGREPGEVGEFGHGAAEIVPHLTDDPLSCRGIEFGQRPAQIAFGDMRDGKAGAETARHESTELGGGLGGEQAEEGEESAGQARFEAPEQAAEEGRVPRAGKGLSRHRAPL